MSRFFTVSFPAALYRARWWWGLSALASLVLALAVGWWVAVHPQVIGQAHHMMWFEKLVEHIASKDGVWFATCEEIAKAWVSDEEDEKPARGGNGASPGQGELL